jgi:radical SAM protein with 4Fe4S-binding SPASM domain
MVFVLFLHHADRTTGADIVAREDHRKEDALFLREVIEHRRVHVVEVRAQAARAKCSRCEFRSICGGSLSRAYAASGDAFGSDPLCSYVPSLERTFATGEERSIMQSERHGHDGPAVTPFNALAAVVAPE